MTWVTRLSGKEGSMRIGILKAGWALMGFKRPKIGSLFQQYPDNDVDDYERSNKPSGPFGYDG